MGNARTQALPAIVAVLLAASAYAGDKLDVRIVDRLDGASHTGFLLSGFSPGDAARERALRVWRDRPDVFLAGSVAGGSCVAGGVSMTCTGDGANTRCSTQASSPDCTRDDRGRPRSGERANACPDSLRPVVLALQLPDSRIAVVHCTCKAEWSNPDTYRSCRAPLVPNIQAEFDGDKAKLNWPVSLDGRKTQSETYRVLAVFDKPNGFR
jgi:hypothetical protein